MPMAYFDSILVTRLTVDFNRENGGLVFQPFWDFRVEIFTEDGHFLAISVFTSKVPGRCSWIQWMGNSHTFKNLEIQNGDIFEHREIFLSACKKL